MTFRNGVRPNDPSKPRLHLGQHLYLAAPPTSINWDRAVPAFPMYGNDRYGDCVWAMIGHTIQTWSVNAGKEVQVPTASLLKAYHDVTGWVASDPSTDQGTVMQDAFNYWRTVGIIDATGKAHKILAFAQVDHTSFEEMKAAAALFGEVLLAIDFPDSAMDQFNNGQPWDVVHGAQIEGGHAICSARYDGERWWVITWAKEQEVTPAFLTKYLQEAWVAIGPEWLEANGTAPSGLDLHGLGEDFASLTGSPNPFPGPNPPNPPVPPPSQDLLDAATALANDPSVHSWLISRHRGPAKAIADRVNAVIAAVKG